MTGLFAMVFPGQGSQSTAMLSELANEYPQIRATFDLASAVLDINLWEITQEKACQAKLNQTRYTQPIMLAADVAVFKCWKQRAPDRMPRIMAGHSLGEYSALVCAEAVSFEQAIQLVATRGKYMEEAATSNPGAMAVIIGLGADAINDLCTEVMSQTGYVQPANFNSPLQTVVAGQLNAVKAIIESAKRNGGRPHLQNSNAPDRMNSNE